MSIKTNLLRAGALGAAVTVLTAGAAFAAVATTSVNVRSGPSTSYRVVDTLAPGERVNITGQSNGWCAVTKPGPKAGSVAPISARATIARGRLPT